MDRKRVYCWLKGILRYAICTAYCTVEFGLNSCNRTQLALLQEWIVFFYSLIFYFDSLLLLFDNKYKYVGFINDFVIQLGSEKK